MKATVIQTGVSHSGLGEGSGFLRCDDVSLGTGNSSAYTTLIVQAEGQWSFKTLGSTYLMTNHHIPEEASATITFQRNEAEN